MMRPDWGLSRPLKCFTRVVFPAPFSPIMATNSPLCMVTDTSSRASTPLG